MNVSVLYLLHPPSGVAVLFFLLLFPSSQQIKLVYEYRVSERRTQIKSRPAERNDKGSVLSYSAELKGARYRLYHREN